MHHTDTEEIIHRHRLGVRVCHWINALSFFFLAVSGVAILIMHPELYWGNDGYYGHDAWLTIPFLKLEVVSLETITSNWGRNYHFLFAWVFVVNGLVYLVSNLINKHFRRDILPTRNQLSLAHMLTDIRDHLSRKVPVGDAERQYNLIQKLTYVVVIFILCPLMFVSGLSIAPGITTIAPELLDLIGGRQSARSIHFICASLLVLFVVVHVAMVFVAGFKNHMRGMITGKFSLQKESHENDEGNHEKDNYTSSIN